MHALYPHSHAPAQVTYWVFGLPVSIVMAFWGGLGALGLWTGLACTASIQALLMACTVFKCGARARVEGGAHRRAPQPPAPERAPGRVPTAARPLPPTRFDWSQEAQRAKALVDAGELVLEEEPF